MKTLLLLLVASVSILAACKKKEIVPGLIGKWELRRADGGFAYHDSTYQAGNGNIYLFRKDSTYKKYDNGTLSASGKFHIHTNTYPNANSITTITFGDDTNGYPIVVTDNKMSLGALFADGVAYEYAKIY